MAAAGAFVCCGMFALEGLAAQFLPYRPFLRVSGFLQLAAFFAILSAWFLTAPRRSFPWLPSSWLYGLEQQLSGRVAFHRLAPRALGALVGVCGGAAVGFALSYGRSIRKIVEQPDISDRGPPKPPLAALWLMRF